MKIKRKYDIGSAVLSNDEFKRVAELNEREIRKSPARFDIINYLLSTFDGDTTYLEIGVRDPSHNFNKIQATQKYSVDPGIEFKENPVDFKLTSDDFFEELNGGKVLSKEIRFDVIFIDGLHTAEQVERDIENSKKFLAENGFIVLHDCNPPSAWHATEKNNFHLSPAGYNWNGTTWKAFVKARQDTSYSSCCIDSDWGVGIISKNRKIGEPSEVNNPFFEFDVFERNRVQSLGLCSFEDFQSRIGDR